MTNALTGEPLQPQVSPYARQQMQANELGLQCDVNVTVEHWQEEITDLDKARQAYDQYGAVILSPKMTLEVDDHPWPVAELSAATSDYVIERLGHLWDDPNHGEIIKQKDYTAYNGTERHLRTVSPENVSQYLPQVLDLQRKLLPVVRAINGDPQTEISTDEDEGTVINLQLFDPGAEPSSRQQHGAHTDRVDTTTVVCLDNIGAHGELVFVHGYTEACRELGLDPHRNFDINIDKVLAADPRLVVFRVHDVRPGNIVMIKSAEDVHFITAKTLGDVQAGLEPGQKPRDIGGLWLGRGIINMAFETTECRRIDQLAHQVEDHFKVHDNRGENFFTELDKALGFVPEDQREAVRNAIVTWRSATDLYQKSGGQASF